MPKKKPKHHHGQIQNVLNERTLSTKSSYEWTDLQACTIKYHSVFKVRCISESKFGPDSECIITELNPRGPVHSFTTCTSPFYINEQFRLIAAHQSGGVISPSSFILSTFQKWSDMNNLRLITTLYYYLNEIYWCQNHLRGEKRKEELVREHNIHFTMLNCTLRPVKSCWMLVRKIPN